VIHGFIDGYSRLITGLRASDNNLASTVLDLFLNAVAVYGVPSRLRGDHGVENLLVAAWMLENLGLRRYIWGRYEFYYFISCKNLTFPGHNSTGVFTMCRSNVFGLMSLLKLEHFGLTCLQHWSYNMALTLVVFRVSDSEAIHDMVSRPDSQHQFGWQNREKGESPVDRRNASRGVSTALNHDSTQCRAHIYIFN
jgi:hypothetical protein